jgi:subtilisin family serine protease
MLPTFLARCRHLLRMGLWACVVIAVPGCMPASPSARTGPPAVEQASPETFVPADRDAPQARRLHLERLGVTRWHEQGFEGQGVKIAVLDSGFRGYRDFLGAGLPPRVRARSFRADRNLEARDSQHGILCAEAIHALAPRAELLFANWEPDSADTFLEAVRWARAEGARVLSCSLIMPSWSDGEGGGSIHDALADLLDADVLCCASAGNIAQRHWTGLYCPDQDGHHQWETRRARKCLTPWGRERVAVELYGATHLPLEVLVYHHTQRSLVGRAVLQSDASAQCSRAVIRFEPDPGASYHVVVRGPVSPRGAEGRFHLVVLGASLDIHTSEGSIAFPADGAGVLAVGAVDDAGQRTAYSSCGPNSRRPKPDFVAPVPFPSLCRERPFAGTSAAAPQAAALAGLLWSRHPEWTAAQVRAALRAAAEDLGPPGHDFETGHGLIRLPQY